MLERLKFSILFPTGKSFSRELDFLSGTTAISGPNGAGKSLTLEMVLYALFGVDAVRGAAGDYGKSEVHLTFSARGESYRVERRNGTSAAIYRDETPIATGTRAVNAKVVEVLGYGLNVFKVANAVQQGQIEALSTMLPTERKRLIDSTIGLDAIDRTAEWANGEALLSRRAAETLRANLVAPVAPEKPDAYQPSAGLKAALDEARALKSESDRIKGWLANPVRAPAPLNPSEVLESAAVLQLLVDERRAAVRKLDYLKAKLAALPPAVELPPYELPYLRDQLERHRLWSAYDEKMAALPSAPALSLDEIAAEQARVKAYEHWKIEKASFDKGKVACPSCGHEFVPGRAAPAENMDKPAYSLPDLAEMVAAHNTWSRKPEEPATPRPEIVIFFNEADLTAWERSLQADVERVDLQEGIDSFVLPPDRMEDWKRRVAYEADLTAYEKQAEAYAAYLAEKEIKEARLRELEGVEEKTAGLQAAYEASALYERLLASYETARAAYEAAEASAAESQHRAEEFKKAAAALKELKARIKTFLVPSLNRVASLLVRQMTEGQAQELESIIVDEDFNIEVDGQPIGTLNGSAKTVANLALRIGLGQILTNKVFSVLLADEVDAACDEERSAAIAGCLRSLTKTIKQVVIVSHKDIEADNYVRV